MQVEDVGAVEGVEGGDVEGLDSTKTNQHMDVIPQQQEEMQQGVERTTTPNTTKNGLRTQICVTVTGGTCPTGTPSKHAQQDAGTHTNSKGVTLAMHRHTSMQDIMCASKEGRKRFTPSIRMRADVDN